MNLPSRKHGSANPRALHQSPDSAAHSTDPCPPCGTILPSPLWCRTPSTVGLPSQSISHSRIRRRFRRGSSWSSNAVWLCSTAQLLNRAASPRSSRKFILNSGSTVRRSKVGSTRLVVLEGEAEALDRLVALGISMLLVGLLEQHLPPAFLAGGAAAPAFRAATGHPWKPRRRSRPLRSHDVP